MKNKQEIFLNIFNPIKINLWRFCLSVSNSRNDAKDLLQETIEVAYRNFEKLKHNEAFLSYLFSIAYRINGASRKNARNHLSFDEIEANTLAADNISPEKIALIKELHEALEILPIEMRTAIVLQEIMGFSQKEICEIQNISLDALKQRLHRAKKKLREIFENNSKIFYLQESNNEG